MNHIERVFTTIKHKEPDKVPKGELGIAKNLMERLLSRLIKDEFSDKIEVMKYRFKGKLGRKAHVYLPDTQGPFDIAHLVRGRYIYRHI